MNKGAIFFFVRLDSQPGLEHYCQPVEYRTYLLFGPPGSGKGTQGKILGSIPGFFHVACGEVFRALDLRSDIGKAFLEFSSKGQLVPDEVVLQLWRNHIQNMITLSRFKPDIDHLVLDGIPRNVDQAKILEGDLDVRQVFHLSCPDQNKLVERMKRRALKENRLDDANEEIIQKRLATYELETAPVLDYYGKSKLVSVDSTQYPYEVLRDILSHINTGE